MKKLFRKTLLPILISSSILASSVLAATELIYPLRDGSGNTSIVGNHSGTAKRLTFTGDLGYIYYIKKIRFILTDDAIFENNFMNIAALTNGIKMGIEDYGATGSFSPSLEPWESATDFTALKDMKDFESVSDVRELKTHDLQSVVYRTAVYEIIPSKPIEIDNRTVSTRKQFTVYLNDDISALNFGRVVIKVSREKNTKDWFLW